MAIASTVPGRLAIAVLLTAVLMFVACAAMYVTTAPELISLLVEPFSLLLMPGLVVAIAFAGAHDFTPASVVCFDSAFYFGFFYWVLWRLARSAQIAPPHSR